jgi:hypothetical protein
MIAWWLLIMAPIAAGLIMDNVRGYFTFDEKPEAPCRSAAITVVVLGIVAVSCVPALETYNPILNWIGRTKRTEDDLYCLASKLRRDEGQGRIFSRFEWGEYLGWSLAPRYKVFMDGRIEIFPDDVWQDFSAVTRGRADWERILDRYGVDYLILDSSGFNADLLPQVRESNVWEEWATSGNAILFRKRPPSQALAGARSP